MWTAHAGAMYPQPISRKTLVSRRVRIQPTVFVTVRRKWGNRYCKPPTPDSRKILFGPYEWRLDLQISEKFVMLVHG